MSRNPLALLVVVAVLALALASDRLRAGAHGAYTEAQTYEDVYYLPPDEWLPVFSLGWDEALADLIWMRALVYFGDELHHSGRVRFVFDYGDAIETLDPDFVAVYRWVGMAGMYRPQAVTTEDIERSVAFMERGAARYPENGDLAWDIGASLAFELVPMLSDPEEKREARERAVPYLLRAARLGAAPDWMVLRNAAMLERLGRADQAARHVEEMLDMVQDPATRARIEARIRRLRTRVEADAFFAAQDELESRRLEDFPYVHPTLHLLLGERPVVDLETPIREGLPAALAAPAQ